jgi:hypothetical protein
MILVSLGYSWLQCTAQSNAVRRETLIRSLRRSDTYLQGGAFGPNDP